MAIGARPFLVAHLGLPFFITAFYALFGRGAPGALSGLPVAALLVTACGLNCVGEGVRTWLLGPLPAERSPLERLAPSDGNDHDEEDDEVPTLRDIVLGHSSRGRPTARTRVASFLTSWWRPTARPLVRLGVALAADDLIFGYAFTYVDPRLVLVFRCGLPLLLECVVDTLSRVLNGHKPNFAGLSGAGPSDVLPTTNSACWAVATSCGRRGLGSGRLWLSAAGQGVSALLLLWGLGPVTVPSDVTVRGAVHLVALAVGPLAVVRSGVALSDRLAAHRASGLPSWRTDKLCAPDEMVGSDYGFGSLLPHQRLMVHLSSALVHLAVFAIDALLIHPGTMGTAFATLGGLRTFVFLVLLAILMWSSVCAVGRAGALELCVTIRRIGSALALLCVGQYLTHRPVTFVTVVGAFGYGLAHVFLFNGGQTSVASSPEATADALDNSASTLTLSDGSMGSASSEGQENASTKISVLRGRVWNRVALVLAVAAFVLMACGLLRVLRIPKSLVTVTRPVSTNSTSASTSDVLDRLFLSGNGTAGTNRARSNALAALQQQLPWNRPNHKVKRIAHCMVGSARTLNYRDVYQNYKHHAVDRLKPHEVDVFAVLDLETSSHGLQIERKGRDDYQKALDVIKPVGVEWGDGKYSHLMRGEFCGFKKFVACGQMVKDYEEKHGFRYDFVVKSRPDLLYLADIPPVAKWPTDAIAVNPYYEFSRGLESLDLEDHEIPQNWRDYVHPVDHRQFGISDIFAVMPRAYLDIYFTDLVRPDLPLSVCGVRAGDCECRVKAALFVAGVRYTIFPVVVKIRRGYSFCSMTHYNHFNTIC